MKKKFVKQVGLFLILCLPLSWLFTAVGMNAVDEAGNVTSVIGMILMNIVYFMPMIAAILTCILTKERVIQLGFFPGLRGSGKVYLFAIFIGVVLWGADCLLKKLIFPDMIGLVEGATIPMVFITLASGLATSVINFFLLFGEEIGWMGYLYPRLERLCGTTLAVLITAFIRTSWHAVMLLAIDNFFVNFVSLFINNLLLGSVLILVTKASGCVIPASIIHAVTNALPAVMLSVVYSNMQVENPTADLLVSMIPMVLIGGACYVVLLKKYPGKKLSKEE